MNWLDQNVGWLAGQLQGSAGTPVVIVRGDLQSEPITGSLTVVDVSVWDADTGIPTKVKVSDWLFTAGDLILDGSAYQAKAGDYFKTVEENEEDVRTFEVSPVDKKSVSEPHDAKGLMVVIHTKEIT